MTASRFDNLSEEEIYANPPLGAYLSKVQKRHGYVRLLGLPDRRDRPNVPIESMFVPPLVSGRPIAVDGYLNGSSAPCESIYEALQNHGRLLLLGDPGTGKTTLIDYLTWQLTFAQERTPFTNRFGWRLPVPMVLRELALGTAATFDGLLNAFLCQPTSEPLKDGVYLRQMLKEGRALLMLDGIDELGGKAARERLRDAVFDGMRRFPDCLWLLSSRIVGYGEVPFEGTHEPALRRHGQSGGATNDPDPRAGAPEISKRYVAPFDNGRIKQFVRNWYAQRDSNSIDMGKHDDLVKAIRKDPALQRLARVPSMLALMALVHRIDATLPHERSVLYERIAEAYLESIDKHRGISESAHNLPRKKMWLARVGYEMQHRREHASDADLLVPCADALHWIDSEMERGKAPAQAPTPEAFLSFVGRRSGLFIPRGDDQYAFSHLSFQEYFAAVALAAEVTGFTWAKEGRSSLGFSRTDIAGWARQRSWLETFCFLFEMLAGRQEWHSELVNCVFGEGFLSFDTCDVNEELFNLGHLAARLAVNPYSGLGASERTQAIEWCVRAQIRYSDYYWRTEVYGPDSSLFGLLMAKDSDLCGTVMESIRKLWFRTTERLELKILDLRGANKVNLRQVAELSSVEVLILSDTDVDDVRYITALDNLDFLELDGTAVRDVTPLGEMPQIRFLTLERTSVHDITPLARLDQLDMLLLSDAPVSSDAVTALQEALPNCEIVKDF